LSFTSSINLTGEIIMNRLNYLEAIETVLAWDLPEEALTNAIHQQVFREIDTEDAWDCYTHQSDFFH
jgi:hypothetical protein